MGKQDCQWESVCIPSIHRVPLAALGKLDLDEMIVTVVASDFLWRPGTTTARSLDRHSDGNWGSTAFQWGSTHLVKLTIPTYLRTLRHLEALWQKN